MITDIHDTLTGKLIQQTVTEAELLALDPSEVTVHTFNTDIGDKPIKVIGLLTTNLTPFPTPITLESRLGKEVYIDLRPMVGKSRLAQGYPACINDSINAGLLFDLGYLIGIYGTAEFNSFALASTPAYRAFVNVVSLLLTSKLSLGPSDGLQVQALLSIMFVDILDYDNNKNTYARAKAVSNIAGDASGVATSWLEANEKVKIKSLEDLAEQINSYATSISLKNLKADNLLLAVRNLVALNNAPILVGASLEYPPAFLAITHTLYMRKSFKRSILGGVIDRVEKKLKPLHRTFLNGWDDQFYLLSK